jgi:hypothetical protein
MSNRIAILVLACATSPYDRMIAAIRSTWASVRVPDIDVFYVFGRPSGDRAELFLSRFLGEKIPLVPDNSIKASGPVLLAGCADHLHQENDCLLRKRLLAFEHLAATGNYDFIYTICATSYINQAELKLYAESLAGLSVVTGPTGFGQHSPGVPVCSGASMLMSVDIARRFGEDKDEIIEKNQFSWRDDLMLGYWIATRICQPPLKTDNGIIDKDNDLIPADIFKPYFKGSSGFVNTDQAGQVRSPGVYHYHFNSKGDDDMTVFHHRYFSDSDQG